MTISLEHPELIGRLAWRTIGYEEFRLAWNVVAANRNAMLRRMNCDRLKDKVERAVEWYCKQTTKQINAFYIMGLNEFFAQLDQTWAFEHVDGQPDSDWYRPIGPPWEEFEYSYSMCATRFRYNTECTACGKSIWQHHKLIISDDAICEDWFCSLDCARWYRKEFFKLTPQLQSFLEPHNIKALPSPVQQWTPNMTGRLLELPSLTMRDPDPGEHVDYYIVPKGSYLKAVRRIVRMPKDKPEVYSVKPTDLTSYLDTKLKAEEEMFQIGEAESTEQTP